MKKQVLAALSLALCVFFAPAQAREAPLPVKLDVKVGKTKDGASIPKRFAYCVPDGKGGTKDGLNINPAVRWSKGPAETKSYVLLVVDKDVPASFELANQKGKVIPKDFKRQDFYHWALVDIPPTLRIIPQGKDSSKITKGGKPLGKTTYGINGKNDYAKISEGTHGGYDGPCPPWNDERLHHYHFQVYALDVKSLGLKDAFTGRDVEKAMKGHIIGKGESVGTYSNNPNMK